MSNAKMELLNTFTYQVRAYKPSPYENMSEIFLGEKMDTDLETAMKVYEAEKDNYENIFLTQTPVLTEDDFNEVAESVGVDMCYDVKYIIKKGVNKQ